MATRLDLTSFRSIFGFFRASMAIRTQVLGSPGAIGVSVDANPFTKRFLTLTAWTDRDALNRFVGTSPHRESMKQFRAVMDHPVFVTWTMPASALPPSWADAQAHLDNDPTRIVR